MQLSLCSRKNTLLNIRVCICRNISMGVVMLHTRQMAKMTSRCSLPTVLILEESSLWQL
jgi:hypothetical protein